MRLDSLTLRGILRFADLVHLDFRELPPGLIAIVGPNGAGKTTLMEAPLAAIYRQFPSRNREVFDYATRTDSLIETFFELEGRGLYQARLALDGPHRKAEAILAQILPDGQRVILNDGKVSTYDTAVATLMPRLDDLLASVFAAQNRVGSFSGLGKKERRILFGSLLGLDHYEGMAERARAAAARTQQEIDRLSITRDALARDAGEASERVIDDEAQRLQVDLGSVELRREELAQLIASAEQALAAVQADLGAHAAAVGHRDRVDAEIRASQAAVQHARDLIASAEKDAIAERSRMDATLTAALARLDSDARDLRVIENERRQITEARDSIVADAEKRIAANEGLLAEADAIRAAVATVKGVDDFLANNRRERDWTQEQIDAVVAEHGRQQTARAAAAAKQANLARVRSDAALLSTVPCHGEGDYAACAFLTKAKQAEQTIPTLAGADDEVATIDAAIEHIAAEHLAFKGRLADLVDEAAWAAEKRAAAQALADKLPNLTEAEAKIAGHRRRISDAAVDYLAGLASAEERERERQARLQRERENRQEEHRGALTVVDATLEERRDRFEQQIAAATDQRIRLEEDRAHYQADIDRTAGAAAAAQVEQAKLTTYRAEWDISTQRLATVEARVEDLNRRRDALLRRRLEIDVLDASIAQLRADLVEWSVLAKALGRDGLPTIEIDQAGPTVSAYANDLLQACYGGRFTLDLVTQAPKTTKGKDGSTHKEVFEANVYDQQRGGELRQIEDLSGGERVIVEEVLRSAIALLVNQRNQQPLRTVWRDETTGALDPENAARYVAMLRRLQEIGGYHHLLFVTHSEDCARLADAQVRVDGGGYEIALPPFVTPEVAA